MSKNVSFDVSDVQRRLNQLATIGTDLAPILNELGEIGLSSIDRNFQEGGRFGAANQFGGGMNHWTRSGRASREAGLTLVDNSTLRGSVNYVTQGHDTIVFTSNLAYSAIHQYGGAAGRNHSIVLPARPYLVLQNEDLEDMAEVVLEYYAAIMNRTS